MPERHAHGGLSNWAVNSGFYAFRTSYPVRRLFHYWARLLKANHKMKDRALMGFQPAPLACTHPSLRGALSNHVLAEDALNFLLLKQMKAEINWTVFPSHLVTTNLSEVTSETIAYHAVPSTACDTRCTKVERLRQAFAARGALAPPGQAVGQRDQRAARETASWCDPDAQCRT